MNDEVKRVIEIFSKQYQDLQAVKVVRYDDHRFLVLANSNGDNYNGSWYGVDLKSQAASSYSPIVEMEKFIKLVQSQTIYEGAYK